MYLDKPYKKSKLTGAEEQNAEQYKRDLDKDVTNLFQFCTNTITTASVTTSTVFQYVYISGSTAGGLTDVYWTYNTATTYLEGWVTGTKRIEL